MRASHYLEAGFCKNVFARTEQGHQTYPTDKGAATWCMEGALMRSQHDRTIDDWRVELLEEQLNEWISPDSYQVWQDAPCRTQAEAIELMKRAELQILGEV